LFPWLGPRQIRPQSRHGLPGPIQVGHFVQAEVIHLFFDLRCTMRN
jgi:hypothetical protein